MKSPPTATSYRSTAPARALWGGLLSCACAVLLAPDLPAQRTVADATVAAREAALARRRDVPRRANGGSGSPADSRTPAPNFAPAADSALRAAQIDLLELPPLDDLLAEAANTAPQRREIAIAQAQALADERIWRLADYDLLTLQGVAIAGRRDVFAVNTDGTVYVPTASVVDNLNTQAMVSVRVNPISFFQNAREREKRRLEHDRLAAVGEEGAREVAEGIIYAHSMARKSLDVMDTRASALALVESRADLAEQQFRSGAMTLADYAEYQSKAADMAAKFEDARGDFRLYYRMLMARVYGTVP